MTQTLEYEVVDVSIFKPLYGKTLDGVVWREKHGELWLTFEDDIIRLTLPKISVDCKTCEEKRQNAIK